MADTGRSAQRQAANAEVTASAQARATAGAGRPAAQQAAEAPGGASPARSLRIGDVARLVGTTPRTIRYYEEVGLLPPAPARRVGGHRLYAAAEVERLREVMRLKDLLGLTLGELKTLLAAEEARAAVRAQLKRDDVAPERRRELLVQAQGHIEAQLALVDKRAEELAKLREELCETRKRVRRRIRELDAREQGSFPPAEQPLSAPAPGAKGARG